MGVFSFISSVLFGIFSFSLPSQRFVGRMFTGYDSIYPLTPPVITPGGIQYQIAIVSDMDKEARSKDEPNTWISKLKKGWLTWNSQENAVQIEWDKEEITLKTNLAEDGRGMELSELLVFNGKLLTLDDHTGWIYELDRQTWKATPWVRLVDGDGTQDKAFKGEWATVKARKLYVGSMGKELTTHTGEFVNNNPMWVKTVTTKGKVSHVSWVDHYKTLRRSIGVDFPGYVYHESAVWSRYHKEWFFLPRRVSKEKYHGEKDPYNGANVLLRADDRFSYVKTSQAGELEPTHGFSTFKFIPGTQDSVIVALKTVELQNSHATYVTVFTVEGKTLMPETKVGDYKYEGLEFI